MEAKRAEIAVRAQPLADSVVVGLFAAVVVGALAVVVGSAGWFVATMGSAVVASRLPSPGPFISPIALPKPSPNVDADTARGSIKT